MNFPYHSDGLTMLIPEAANLNTDGSASEIYNGLSKSFYGFIIPGTTTFAVFGSSAGVASSIGYKITQSDGNLCGGSCAYDADDKYNYYWLFDVNDILNASSVHAPRPYDYGKLSIPFDQNGKLSVIGGSYDPSNNTLYLSLENAGQVGTYDRPPLIIGYKIANEKL